MPPTPWLRATALRAGPEPEFPRDRSVLWIQGEPLAQLLDFAAHHPKRAIIVGRLERSCDQITDEIHLCLAHAPRGDGGCANTNPARDHRWIRVEGDGVLVHRN